MSTVTNEIMLMSIGIITAVGVMITTFGWTNLYCLSIGSFMLGFGISSFITFNHFF